MNRNKVTLKAYSSGTTEATGTGLDLARDIVYDMCYPGGMCTGMSFYVPRDITAQWSVKLGTRIAAWNMLRMTWEGYVSNITPTLTADGVGAYVTCEGAWSRYLQRRKTLKPWADNRMSQDVWRELTTATGFGKYTLDRQNRIMYTPTSQRDAAGAEVGWAITNGAAVTYTAPTGMTIKRVTFGYDLQEAAQAWQLELSTTGGTVLWSVAASGTGTVDHTLATPVQAVRLIFRSMANQVPPSDGTVYGTFTDVNVYTETGSINAQEIGKDISGYISELSTDVSQVGALTLSLVPFYANGAETYADALTRAAGYGDASFNRWAVYVGLSDGVSDNLPRLVLEQVPALTSYDYAVRVEETNVTNELSFVQSLDEVYNWIGLHYTDASGLEVWRTPDDDANLKDTTSITAYGQRETWLEVPSTSQTNATNYGRRYLAQHKDPQWQANGQITITGSVRGVNGQSIPACEVRPGKRIKLENWLNDLSGTGLTLLITGTTYDDKSESVTLDFGQPTTDDVFMLRLQREMEIKR